jgi:dTDP-L-rhamnose 4-epimerase
MEPSWTDEAIANPHNQYAISKYSQEMISLNLGRRYNLPTVCLRYSIVQGPRQSFRNAYSGILRIFTQRLLTGVRPVCYEDGQQLRDYVSVHDVVAANLCALDDDRADFRVFNVGGDRFVSVEDYARLVSERSGISLEPDIPGLYRYGDTRHVFSDVSRLKALGWQPVVSLEQIVDEYVLWVRSQSGFEDHSVAAQLRMESTGAIRRVTSKAV